MEPKVHEQVVVVLQSTQKEVQTSQMMSPHKRTAVERMPPYIHVNRHTQPVTEVLICQVARKLSKEK